MHVWNHRTIEKKRQIKAKLDLSMTLLQFNPSSWDIGKLIMNQICDKAYVMERGQ